jgi:hypothetical protein
MIVQRCVWAATALSIALSNVVAQTSPEVRHVERVSFPQCEFVVQFPSETKRKFVSAQGMELVMVESVYDARSPYFRAECLPLRDPEETKRRFRSVLESQASMAGISEPIITIEQSPIGVVGTYTGTRLGGGFEIRLYGKLIIGKRSLLSLLTSDLAELFPRDQSVIFLNTVEVY